MNALARIPGHLRRMTGSHGGRARMERNKSLPARILPARIDEHPHYGVPGVPSTTSESTAVSAVTGWWEQNPMPT